MIRVVLVLVAICLFGCGPSNDVLTLKIQVERLQAHVDYLKNHLDTLEADYNVYKMANETPDFYWVSISRPTFSRINESFYVTSVATAFKENGVRVTGVIGNLEAMSKTQIQLRAAVFEKGAGRREGAAEASYIGPGAKIPFSVFIPTQEKDIKSVGIKIETYRM